MILEVNPDTGVAKVSCRVGEETQVIEMPISEIVGRLGSSNTLKLDRLSSEETEERVVEKDDRWFFQAREGSHGPYANESEAKQALKRHILAAQEEGRTGRPAQTASA
jgi:hypothetical protein